MFDMPIEATIALTAVGLFVAQALYLNAQFKHVHQRFDAIMEQFGGLREYLYEINPQFDEERRLKEEGLSAVAAGSLSFAPMEHLELIRQKREDGRRTLNSPFREPPPP